MDLPYEVLVHLFKYLSSADRTAASETCYHWREAANDSYFLKKKIIVFHKALLENENTSPLRIFCNSSINYPNYEFNEVEITAKVVDTWTQFGSSVKSLKLKNCDINEKTFVSLLNSCPELEELSIDSCRELFMSGRLMEKNNSCVLPETLNHLKVLSLSGNRYLTDALFDRFVSAAPALRELRISESAVSFHTGLVKKYYPGYNGDPLSMIRASESILTFYYILRFITSQAPFLQKISFSQTLIDGSGLKALSEVEGLKLKSLELTRCDQLTSSGILSLATIQTSLTRLDLGFCSRVTDQSLVHICKYLNNLEYLNIKRCRAVTDLGIAQLSQLKNLISLNISQCSYISSKGLAKGICSGVNRTLKELVASSLNWDEVAIMLISKALPELVVLDISFCFNGVTDTSIQAIFKNLIWLQSFEISCCEKVSDAGLTGMGMGIKNIKETDTPIEPDVNPVPELHRIHLGSRAEEEIVRDAQRKRNVMMLCENITSDTYSGYSIARLKGLRELHLTGCNRITDVSLKYSFNFKELEFISFSRCQQITHEGLEYLVKNCPAVQKCNLSDTYNLKDDAVELIVKGWKRLKWLDLRGCSQITDLSLKAIQKHCTKLKYLDLHSCRNISPELATSLCSLPTMPTVLISKPGPYIDEIKQTPPSAPLLPSFLKRLRFQ